MIKNILLKDLKRKKTMNIIILLFVILATMFVASSVNNIVTVMKGTEYYFEQAGLGNYVILTMGENVWGNLDNFLESEKAVKSYRMEDTIFVSQAQITSKGKKVKFDGSGLIQSLDDCALKFFDADNQVVNHVEPGYVYLTKELMKDNNLKVGDKIRFEHGDVDITLEIKGRLKDALLGSSMMGNPRFLMSHEDYEKFYEDAFLKQYYGGQACYMEVSDDDAINKAMSNVENIAFSANKNLLKLTYVMDMIIAGLLMVVSICLVIVAFVVLKFTITFTLAEEFREIGVMKAIGITDSKIRNLYIIKYLMLSILGAVIGFFGSIPFGNMLIMSASENMVLGNSGGIAFNLVGAILVVVIIVLYAYRCTGKLKKYTPLDAIRSGQTGERYKKKTNYRIGKSHLRPNMYMAVNDVMSSPKRYFTIILAFSICTLLVLMIVNTTETMKSDKLVYTFCKPSDAYMDDVDKSMKGMKGEGHTAMCDILDDIDETLKEHGYDAKASADLQYKYKTAFDGQEYKLSYQQGIRTKASDYVYYEGEAPGNAHEIAITELITEKTGAKIGDTLEITINDKTEEYMITAYFQSMNLAGELIRLHEDADTQLYEASSGMAFTVDFNDNPTPEEIDKRVADMKDIFDCKEVYNSREYSAECIGVVDTMENVELLLLAMTLVVVVLVTILMERSFISDEKGEIAILKAVGFKDGTIIKWHAFRFLIVGAISVVIAIIVSIPATNLVMTPVFGMLGMKSVEFEINLLQVCVIYPVIILAVTLGTALITALYTNTVKCLDTASIE